MTTSWILNGLQVNAYMPHWTVNFAEFLVPYCKHAVISYNVQVIYQGLDGDPARRVAGSA